MAEHAVPLDVGILWEPNAPEAVLRIGDDGKAQLVVQPHPEDADHRPVRLVWRNCLAAVMHPPNDEARFGHRLYDKGLRDVHWIGEVLQSEWIAALERQNRVHQRHDPDRFARFRHFIVLLKECTVEVVAVDWEILRLSAGA